jgi:hypothetical protein
MTLILTFQGELEQALKYLERGMEFHFGNGQQLLADTSESAKTKCKTYAQVNFYTRVYKVCQDLLLSGN